MQIGNVYLCRSTIRSAFSFRFWDNRLIVSGVLLEIVLLVLFAYTSWGNTLLGTAPISGRVWLLVLPLAAGMGLMDELRKWVARRWVSKKRE